MKNQSKKKGNKFEDKVAKTIRSGGLGSDPLDLRYDKSLYEKYCIEAKYTDLKGYRITKNLLESIWEKSFDVSKEPFLIIGIRKNKDEIFMLHCSITVEKDRQMR